MAEIHVTQDIAVPVEAAWEIVRDFAALPKWNQLVASTELVSGGALPVWAVTLHDGQTVEEKLESFDAEGRVFTYSLALNPLPVKDYVATFRVTTGPGGDGATVSWSSSFEPDGVSEDEAVATMTDTYKTALGRLRELLEA